MTKALAILTLIIVASAGAADQTPFPFETVALRTGSIEAKLRAGTKFLVESSTPAESRLSTPGEVFVMRDRESLTLVHRHVFYRVTARLTAIEAGITIECTADASSVGGGVTKEIHFVRAQ